MDLGTIGKWLLAVGLGTAGLGLAFWLAGRLELPLGRLPGDVQIRGQRWSFYFPIATCIVVSLVLTIVLNILLRLFR